MAALASLAAFVIYIERTGPHSYIIDDIEGQKYLVTSEGEIRYQANLKPNSVPVLFLHGFNGSMNNWESVWNTVSHCTSSVRLDIPGFGKSEWQSSDYSLSTQSRNLINFLQALGIEKVHIVGTSMGASLAAWFSAYYPEYVVTTTLLAPSGWPRSMSLSSVENLIYHESNLNAFLTKISNSSLYRTVFPNSRLLQALTVTRSYNDEWVKALSLIQSPTNLIWSESDTRMPIQYQEKIANNILNSHVMLAKKEAGHDIPGKDPEIVSSIFCH
ncbi:alpha/beta fold hydrolase [Reinekea sp.]|uniref:alpha/beta fold hydrolase n=1 Tax=Reinekea sp. TaxID=1970455 RepID=UPI00398A36CE